MSRVHQSPERRRLLTCDHETEAPDRVSSPRKPGARRKSATASQAPPCSVPVTAAFRNPAPRAEDLAVVAACKCSALDAAILLIIARMKSISDGEVLATVRRLFDLVDHSDREIFHRNVALTLCVTQQLIAAQPKVSCALTGSEVRGRRKKGGRFLKTTTRASPWFGSSNHTFLTSVRPPT